MNQQKNDSRSRSVLLVGLIVVVAVIVVRAPWRASFWLDESLTAWIVAGKGDFFARVTEQPQSLLYHTFLRGWATVFGSSEISIRLPSFVLTLVSLAMLFLIARRLEGVLAGLIAALIWISHEQSAIAMLSARPYALGVCGVLLATLGLLYAGEQSIWAARFSIAIGLVVAVAAQPLFIVSYGVLFAIATHVLRAAPDAVRRSTWKAYICGVMCGLVVIGFQAYIVFHSTSLSFARVPSFVDLLFGIIPPQTAVVAGVSLLIGAIYSNKSLGELRSLFRMSPVVWLWVLAAPIGFFVVSRYLPVGSFWVPRYWAWQSAGLALLLGIMISRMVGTPQGWIPALILVTGLTAREFGRDWQIEGWREAAAVIRQETDVQESPVVFLTSGLVEQRDADWILRPEHRPYLSSPLSMYGLPSASIVPVLEGSQGEIEYFFEKWMVGTVQHSRTIWLVGKNKKQGSVSMDSLTLRAYRDLLQRQGFHVGERREFGLVTVYGFWRE